VDIGLVDEVLPVDGLDEPVAALAAMIAQRFTWSP
jgi:hypothetical protein